METLIVEPKTKKQLEVVKVVLKALEVSFRKSDESLYSPEFVAKMERSKRQVEEDKTIKITLNEI